MNFRVNIGCRSRTFLIAFRTVDGPLEKIRRFRQQLILRYTLAGRRV